MVDVSRALVIVDVSVVVDGSAVLVVDVSGAVVVIVVVSVVVDGSVALVGECFRSSCCYCGSLCWL